MTDADWAALKQLLATPQLAELGPARRPGTLSETELTRALKPILSPARHSARSGELIRALLLLWHEHLDASHAISQGIEDADGSFLHALMHRREPDFWNAKYWWRRVGAHPAFPEIARRAGDVLRRRGAEELAKKILPGGKWDTFAFVDSCEKDSGSDVLRELQRIEFEVLLERFGLE